MPKIHMNDPEGYRGEMIEIGVIGRRRTRHAGHGVYELHDGSLAAKSFCGIASWRRGSQVDYVQGTTLPAPDFFCLPRAAQCEGCRRRFEAYATKWSVDRSHPIRRGHECATEEMIVSVEAFLHWVVRRFDYDFVSLEEIPLYALRR